MFCIKLVQLIVISYERLVLGEMMTNTYIVWDEDSKECLVIDPADEGVFISEEIEARQLKLTGVFLTHGHFDHLLAALDLKLIYQVPIFASSKDKFLLDRVAQTAAYFLGRKIEAPNIKAIDKDLQDIHKITLGKEKAEIILTPGHTPGSVSLYFPKSQLLFSGDTVFADSWGRTDLSYSQPKQIMDSIKRLLDLPGETKVLSGHGEETSIEGVKGRLTIH